MADLLPTELIELIFSFVDENDKAACAAICRTNKLGRKIATPLLYRRLGFNGNVRSPERTRRLQCLCNTFSTNPGLTGYVEEVKQQLDRSFTEKVKAQCDYRQVWTKLFRQDMNLVHWLRNFIEAMIIQDFPEISSEICFTAVLLACSRVKRMELFGDLSILKRMKTLAEVINSLRLPPSIGGSRLIAPETWGRTGLHSVRQIQLRHTSESGLLTTRDLATLLYIPGLQSLSTNVLTYPVAYGIEYNPTAPCSNVKSLEINGCDASWHDLEYIFRCCQSLKCLQIERTDHSESGVTYDWDDLREALRRYNPGIELVSLRGPEGPPSQDSDTDLGSLPYASPIVKDIKSLQTLAASSEPAPEARRLH